MVYPPRAVHWMIPSVGLEFRGESGLEIRPLVEMISLCLIIEAMRGEKITQKLPRLKKRKCRDSDWQSRRTWAEA